MQGELTTGEWVAGYVVESSIGSGGMGTVYRVRSQGGQPFAMKIVNRMEGSTEEEFAGRLAREANVARVVRHPGLVKVHAHGLLDTTRAYLVMDLLQGRDLDACLAAQSLSLLEYVELIREALGALEAAHSVTTLDGMAQPIVHRDLKPSNLFLLDQRIDGVRLKIVDFGLVRQHGAKTLTRAGAGFGTICYMAPEQFTGARTASPETDVWAIGVMLYEVVAGFRPFLTEDMATTLSAIGKGHPTRLDALVPACPARYATLVDSCLEPTREQRPGSAAVVLRELDALLDDPAFIAFANGRRALDPEQRGASAGSPVRTPTALAQTMQSGGPSPAEATPAPALPVQSGSRVRVVGLATVVLMLVVGAAFSWRRATREATASAAPSVPSVPAPPASAAITARLDAAIASPCPEGMVYVTAGDTDLEAQSPRGTVARARVANAFCIDRDETSFEEIADWCMAADATDPATRDRACDAIDRCMSDADPIWRGGGRAGTDAWPQPCVGPQEAMRFCADRAHGARLPTGAEWLRAATGGHASRLPWSETDNASPTEIASHAVVYSGTGSAYTRFERFGAARTSGASPFGVLDLVGSLAEWSCASITAGRCVEPSMRGGSLLFTAAEIAESGGLFAAEHGASAMDAVGFRCVVDARVVAP